MKKVFILIALNFFLLSLYAQAPKDCETALIQDTELELLHLSERLIAYSLLTKDQYEEKQKAGQIKIPGYLTGNWSEFSTSITSIFQSSGYLSSLDAKREYSKYYLSANSTQAYLGCLETIAKQNYGFNYFIESISDENIVLFFRWQPKEMPKGQRQATLKVEIATSGAIDPTKGQSFELSPNQDKPFIFKRNKGEEFVLVASPSFGKAITMSIPARTKFSVVKEAGPTINETFEAYCENGDSECAGGGTMSNKQCFIEVYPPTGYVFEQNPRWYNLVVKDFGGTLQEGTIAELVSSSSSKITLNVGCKPSTNRGAEGEGTLRVGTYRYIVKEL